MLIPSRLRSVLSDKRSAVIAALFVIYLVFASGMTNSSCCQGAAAKESSEQSRSATAGVTAVLEMQAAAWNRGDLDTFLTGYVNGPETSYVSGSSEVWGYDALHARYKNKYGDNHESMGTLAFSQLKVQELGRHNALCIGHWHLDRSGQPPVEGIFSLVCVYTGTEWKIMHDHTSVSSTENSDDKH